MYMYVCKHIRMFIDPNWSENSQIIYITKYLQSIHARIGASLDFQLNHNSLYSYYNITSCTLVDADHLVGHNAGTCFHCDDKMMT